MTRLWRRAPRLILTAALVLALGWTGIAAAMARGQVAPGGQIAVLCSGGGLVQVVLDAEGKPTGKTHLCPDLAASLLLATALAIPSPKPRPLAHALRWRAEGVRVCPQHRPVTRARGPPEISA